MKAEVVAVEWTELDDILRRVWDLTDEETWELYFWLLSLKEGRARASAA